MKKHFKKNSQKISKNRTKSENISKNVKKNQNISKCLKMSLMLFFKRGFARLGSVLHIFLDHRKFQKISKKIKIFQNISKYLKISQNIPKYLKFAGKKEKTRKNKIKLTQPYNNFAEASGRIAAQLSAVIIFPCVVKC
jgi:hypothetical protein